MISQIIGVAKGERQLLYWFPWWGDVLWILGWSVIISVITWGLCKLIQVNRLQWLAYLGLVIVLSFSIDLFLDQLCLFALEKGYWLPLIPTKIALLSTLVFTIILYSQTNSQYFLSRQP